MATSRVPAALDALIAALRGSSALTGVRVYDGPELADGAVEEGIWVGYNGDPDADEPAVAATQEWAGLGARAKDEAFSVTCCAIVRSGSTAAETVRAARNRVYVLFAGVEDAVRADPSLGLPKPAWFSTTAASLFQEPTTAGTQARLVFTVDAQKTRI
jgi:hypothetical protein